VPLASLAAILVLVSYHMSEWRSFAGLLRAPKSDIFVLIVTFALTVFVDLTVAVQAGVVAASLLFMRRMAEVTNIEGVAGELSDASAIDDPDSITQVRKRKRTIAGRVIPNGVEIYEVNGPFFFGAADKIREVVGEIEKPPRVLILRMRNVPAIDATGIHALEQLALKCKSQATLLILAEVREQPRSALARVKNNELFANRVTTLDEALDRAGELD
jgi:SulP family sulfate permease